MTKYVANGQNIAQLQERSTLLAEKVCELEQHVVELKAERDQFKDDVRLLVGLKRATPVGTQAPTPTSQPINEPANKQFQVNETPRQYLVRMQMEMIERARKEDRKEMTAALATFEEDLRK